MSGTCFLLGKAFTGCWSSSRKRGWWSHVKVVDGGPQMARTGNRVFESVTVDEKSFSLENQFRSFVARAGWPVLNSWYSSEVWQRGRSMYMYLRPDLLSPGKAVGDLSQQQKLPAWWLGRPQSDPSVHHRERDLRISW